MPSAWWAGASGPDLLRNIDGKLLKNLPAQEPQCRSPGVPRPHVGERDEPSSCRREGAVRGVGQPSSPLAQAPRWAAAAEKLSHKIFGESSPSFQPVAGHLCCRPKVVVLQSELSKGLMTPQEPRGAHREKNSVQMRPRARSIPGNLLKHMVLKDASEKLHTTQKNAPPP